ncbi:MAG: STAS domain-containing protein [Cytophagales bacterium]|jgi:anti-sigma B factor antagonist|nr:STAS domain-containing protein [Cytophagales bacterium]
MKISTLDKDKFTIISINGDLDASSSIILDSSIEKAVTGGGKNLLIDGTQLNYISSAGLGVFMSRVQEFEERGIRMVLYGLSEKIFRVFQILGLDQLLSIVPSEEDAMRQLNTSP